MLYKGAKPAALYRGAYKPGKLYKGTQLVAGYGDVTKAAPASWDGTYDDVMGVSATGKGKQDGTPTPSAPVPLVAAEGALTASGRTGTTSTTVTLPELRAIPGTDIRDTLAYIGGGQWQVTRRVGVIGSYAGESVGSTWASSTGQLTTGAVVWYALATPTTETLTLGELPSYPVHTELAVSGDYPPDVTATVKVGT